MYHTFGAHCSHLRRNVIFHWHFFIVHTCRTKKKTEGPIFLFNIHICSQMGAPLLLYRGPRKTLPLLTDGSTSTALAWAPQDSPLHCSIKPVKSEPSCILIPRLLLFAPHYYCGPVLRGPQIYQWWPINNDDISPVTLRIDSR